MIRQPKRQDERSLSAALARTSVATGWKVVGRFYPVCPAGADCRQRVRDAVHRTRGIAAIDRPAVRPRRTSAIAVFRRRAGAPFGKRCRASRFVLKLWHGTATHRTAPGAVQGRRLPIVHWAAAHRHTRYVRPATTPQKAMPPARCRHVRAPPSGRDRPGHSPRHRPISSVMADVLLIHNESRPLSWTVEAVDSVMAALT